MTVKIGLLAFIVVLTIVFIVKWARSVSVGQRRAGETGARAPTFAHIAIGFVTNFFDTLGIGSYATTTTAYKTLRLVPDECIPGTMIIGHSLPVVAQALIFLTVVEVDSTLLVSMIAVSIIGAWLGAGVVTKLPRRPIQIGMGTALLVAATIMALSQLGLVPGGGTALALPLGRMLFAVGVSFIVGALLMLGIGNYGPTLILLSLLGMNPRAAFPIMMGSGALVGMAGGLRFMKTDRYDVRAALGLTVGGIPAVLIAGLIVRQMPLGALRWLVVVVVTYAAAMMLRSALLMRSDSP
jgi:uncharacterized membrane protein YfcA